MLLSLHHGHSLWRRDDLSFIFDTTKYNNSNFSCTTKRRDHQKVSMNTPFSYIRWITLYPIAMGER